MEAKKFRDMSSEELVQKEKAFKKELFDLNHQRKIGAVEKPSRFSALRKDIARIHTILKEREAKK
jgi:large subunit ribosomal protein L29